MACKRELRKAITKLGGVRAVAKLCDKYTTQVYTWIRDDKYFVPDDCAAIIEKASGIKIPKKYCKKKYAKNIFPDSYLNVFIPLLKKMGTAVRLADEIGISQSYMTKILTGKRPVNINHIHKLCDLSDGKIKPKQLRPDIFKK